MNYELWKIKSVIIVTLIAFLLGGGNFGLGKVLAQELGSQDFVTPPTEGVQMPEEPEEPEEEGEAGPEIEPSRNLRILYQGQLTDAEGYPVAEARYDLRFRIYDAEVEGNILWEEKYTAYQAILVKDGQFKIILGRLSPLNLYLDQAPFWLAISVGEPLPEGGVLWGPEMTPRKKIITLSELLGDRELTPEEWANLDKLIREKLGQEGDVIVLFDLSQLAPAEEETIKIFPKIWEALKEIFNFIVEKLSEIGEKINEILSKLREIISTLANIKQKIDVLYDILIVQKGLAPAELPQPEPEREEIENESQLNISSTNQQITGRGVIPRGKISIRIESDLITETSLIFVAFSPEPEVLWKISKNPAEKSFSIILENPVDKDLSFEYWIVAREPAELLPAEQLPEEIIEEEIPSAGEQPEEEIPEEKAPPEIPSEETLPEETPPEAEAQPTEEIQTPSE